MSERRIEYVPLAELEGAPRNPKLHALEPLGSSIDTFGYVEPVVVDDRTGRLVAGHGRVDDLSQRLIDGSPAPDGIVIDEAGRWTVPVVRGWASADDSAADGYLVASNRVPELGGWDADLVDHLEDLIDSGMGLAPTGFTADDLDDLMAASGQGELPPEPFQGGYGETEEEVAARSKASASTREARGLHELVLVFQVDHYREYRDLLARLRRAWHEDTPALLVLRALQEAQ